MLLKILILWTYANNVWSAIDPARRNFYSKENDFFEKEDRKLPDAIIIGVKKGGTRALLEYLRLNPAVKAPGPEVHYFDRHFDRGWDWYRRQMPPTLRDQITIEKTPSYFVTKLAPERVARMNPRVKLLVVVRDPVTRAISDYTQTASKRVGMPSFDEMAFNATTGAVNTSWGAIKIGLYHRHTKKWLKYFPLSQIHFVSGERLITDPALEMNMVEDFLGLDRRIKREDFVFDSIKGFPCLVKNDTKPHCLGKTKGRTHPELSSEIIDRLRAFYLMQNDKFYRLIGQKFKW